MIWVIAKRELRGMFLSPLAWSILAVVQFILGYMFLVLVEEYFDLQPKLATLQNPPGATALIASRLFSLAAIVMLMVTPLLTMRLISEERRNRTLSLLMSAPLSMTEIILGKYVGLLLFLLIMLLLIALMPVSLAMGTNLDWGQLLSGVLGMALLLAAFAAAGLFLSTMTDHPTVAAVSTFGLLLLLWIINWVTEGSLFAYLSLLRHHEAMLGGVVDTSDIVYYLLFILTFLVLAIRRLDAERLQD